MLSLEDKVGQMLAVGFDGLEPPPTLLDWLASGRAGTVFLHARNIASPNQVIEMTQAVHVAARHPLLIAIDQEGGTAAQLRQGFSESPGAMALGAADSEELAERVSGALGAELRALGINWNFAPVLDLARDIANPSVGTRSLSSDSARAAQLGAAQVRGFQRAGVASTAKHFPGLGNTPVNTHLARAVIDDDAALLREHDLAPFRAAVDAGVAALMTTHAHFPAFDPECPATLSSCIIQGLLREEIGFDGVVITDCMEMRAIADRMNPGESALLAALAGQDVILFSETPALQAAAYDALLHAACSGELPESRIDDAVSRVLGLKQRYGLHDRLSGASIGNPDHLATMRLAARRGTALLRNRPDLLPLREEDPRRIAVVEFAPGQSKNGAQSGRDRGFAGCLVERIPAARAITFDGAYRTALVTRARRVVAESHLLVLATRSAHLDAHQFRVAQELLDVAPQTILVCLRNPYDAGALAGADAVLCTFGDSAPSLEAAVDALLGQFTPHGRLPVTVEVHS